MQIISEVGVISVPLSNLVINQELKEQNVYRSPQEREALKIQIQQEKIIRDPFCVWRHQDEMLLVDGFTRYQICMELNKEASDNDLPLPHPVIKCHLLEFDSLEEAKYWITINQNTRRNLTPVQKTYQMGKIYNKLQSRDQVAAYLKASNQAVPSQGENMRSVLLSEHFNVSEKTIRRAAIFAQGLDRILDSNQEWGSLILRGEPVDGMVVNQNTVMEIGKIEKKDYREIKWKSVAELIRVTKLKNGATGSSNSSTIQACFKKFLSSPTDTNLEEFYLLLKEHQLNIKQMKVA